MAWIKLIIDLQSNNLHLEIDLKFIQIEIDLETQLHSAVPLISSVQATIKQKSA